MKKQTKPTAADIKFLEAYRQAGFINATAVYQELYPDTEYYCANAKCYYIKNKPTSKEWLQEQYQIITARSQERGAKYIKRLEAAYFDPECKSTAISQMSRILLKSAGFLDDDDSNSGIDKVEFTVELNEKGAKDAAQRTNNPGEATSTESQQDDA